MMTPVFIQSSEPEPPARCPECDKLEKTKLVCAHCGYEYETEEDDPPTLAAIIMTVVVVALGFYVFLTGLSWVFQSDKMSLADVFRSQLDWLKDFQVFGTKKRGPYR